MNVLANIAPAYQSLGAFLPWQLLAIIPVTIGAVLTQKQSRVESLKLTYLWKG
jgi:hypothetical protein